MKYLIVLLFVFACNEPVPDPKVDQLTTDLAALKKEVNNFETLQAKIQSDVSINKTDVEQFKKSMTLINKLISTVELRISEIELPDTIFVLAGNNNVIYNRDAGRDTVNIIMSDSVHFKIWHSGSEIIEK